MAGSRVSTLGSASPAAELPVGRQPVRVSLVWLDGGGIRVAPGWDGRPCTVVVQWPTLPDGRAIGARVHEADAVLWPLDRLECATLADLARDWPLDRHDLVVTRGRIRPCLESCIQAAADGRNELARRVYSRLISRRDELVDHLTRGAAA